MSILKVDHIYKCKKCRHNHYDKNAMRIHVKYCMEGNK